MPSSKHKQKINRKSDPLIWPFFSSFFPENEDRPCWPICGCSDKAQRSALSGAGIFKNQNFGLLFSAALLGDFEVTLQFLDLCFHFLFRLQLLCVGVCGTTEGVGLWGRCRGCGRRRRDRGRKVLPSGNSRLFDQLSCSPDHSVRVFKSPTVDFKFGVNVESFTAWAVLEEGCSAQLPLKTPVS